jgi:hypothetical protein
MWAPNFLFNAAQVACWLVVTAACWDADGCSVGDGTSPKTCGERLVLNALGVDPEKLMVSEGKGGCHWGRQWSGEWQWHR